MLARKLNLRPEIRQELFDGAREIVRLVTIVDPTLSEYGGWMLSEEYETNGKSKVTYLEDGTKRFDPDPIIPEATWESLKNRFAFIPQFLERFGLSNFYVHIPYFGVSQTHHENYNSLVASDAHRHAYRTRSRWSLTLFDQNTEGSQVYFVDPEIPSLVREPGPNPEDEFHHLPSGVSPKILDQLIVNDYDAYAFNTWEWHTYYYNPGSSTVHVFYLEGAVDEESMEKACQRLESM